MRFYQGTHKFYAGVDLHTKTMYVCVRHDRQEGKMTTGFYSMGIA